MINSSHALLSYINFINILDLIEMMTISQSYKEIQAREEIISKTQSILDCSLYDDDDNVLASFPF